MKNIMYDIGMILITCSLPFFISGTIGLLRFPDIYTRLHALTKADNVGLGFIIFGLALQADSLLTIARLFLVWLLVLTAGSTACHLVARNGMQKKIAPWARP